MSDFSTPTADSQLLHRFDVVALVVCCQRQHIANLAHALLDYFSTYSRRRSIDISYFDSFAHEHSQIN